MTLRDFPIVLCGAWQMSQVSAQNFAPNPDFEAHGDCSAGADWGIILDWTVPLGCVEAGYLNACTPPPLDIYQGVPANFLGYEPAHSGVGYISVRPFSYTNPDPKSYATATLTTNLPPGEHCVRFWMSLADSSKCRTNTFHALLTYSFPEVLADQDSTWAQDAQVTFNTSAVDGNGWYLMQGSFTTTETLRRLTLGNFLKGAELLADTVTMSHSETWPTGANYYIDDVFVGPCDVAVPEFHSTKHVTIAPNPVQQGMPIVVSGSGSEGCAGWHILSGSGLQVAQGSAARTAGALRIPTDGLAAGSYLLQLEFLDGHRLVRPLVVF